MKKRIYVWGTGRLAGMVIGRYINVDDIEGFVDNDFSKTEYMNKKVISPSELKTIDYDAIVVANLFSKEIHKQCLEMGLDINRNIYMYSNCYLDDLNQDYAFVRAILGEQCAETVEKRYHVIRGAITLAICVLKKVDFQKAVIWRRIMCG